MLISLHQSEPSSGSEGGFDPTEMISAEGQEGGSSKELWVCVARGGVYGCWAENKSKNYSTVAHFFWQVV